MCESRLSNLTTRHLDVLAGVLATFLAASLVAATFLFVWRAL